MSLIEKAISIAIHAHKNQTDKSGQPYILHPLRLMFTMQLEDERIIAVLHDTIEDSDYSLDDLSKHGFSDEIIAAIDCLTRRKDENYTSFINRISKNTLATKVKIADLKDNMDLSRLETVTEKDLTRVKKYHDALSLLVPLQMKLVRSKTT